MNTSLLKKCLCPLLLAACLAEARAAIKVGDTFPDLSGFKLEGKLPEKMKGKIVIVDFWASWCAPCAKALPVLEELQKKYGDRLVVVAVNVDDKASNMEKFLKSHPVSLAVVRDAEKKLVARAGPATMPTSYVLDGEGRVRHLHSGFHGEQTRKEYIAEIDALLK